MPWIPTAALPCALSGRRTRVSRQDLIGLERKLRLVALHGGPVLATSNAAALPYYNQNTFVCCCGVPHGALRGACYYLCEGSHALKLRACSGSPA